MKTEHKQLSELNDRRTQLLKAVIEEYVRTAEPVGSKYLVRRCHLRVSPATVRNEMAILVENGFLAQPHTSAGRIPAPLGLRYYIYQLMEEDTLPVIEEVAVKQRLLDTKEDLALFMRNIVKLLADKLKLAAVLVLDNDCILASGAVNLIENPEFYDIDVTKAVLSALDNPTLLREIFSQGTGEDVQVLIGDEIELAHFDQVGIVFSPVTLGNTEGYLAVIGPIRMRYPAIIPALRYFSEIISEA